ncbi:type 2 isopentenyl-diphosphate Delta-isomerase [Candidatus Microgenomates bacterium]|nr:type 2 isopentenyl-diphosphate Delta-isomerase [Candidatus Microgenomates bacterium]
MNNKQLPYKKSDLARLTEERKKEHITIQLTRNVEYKNKTNLFEDVFLVHNALPELDRSQVDMSTTFLRHTFSAPLMVAAITGGAKIAEQINKNIARSCQALGIGMGLGSMKAMLVDPNLTYSYQVRDVAPNIFLAANIGANDLKNFTPKVLNEALKKIGADILAVHLNPAQELVQKEGETSFAGVLDLIKRYSQEVPMYVKEVGQGISDEVAQRLSKTAIQAIDVGGAGGTSWIGIEYLRRGMDDGPYWDWGIPTAMSLILTRRATKLPLIATGGMRTGEEVVKALMLGARISGIALPILRVAARDYDATKDELSKIVKEIGDVMFLLGAHTVSDLRNSKPLITGKLNELI